MTSTTTFYHAYWNDLSVGWFLSILFVFYNKHGAEYFTDHLIYESLWNGHSDALSTCQSISEVSKMNSIIFALDIEQTFEIQRILQAC